MTITADVVDADTLDANYDSDASDKAFTVTVAAGTAWRRARRIARAVVQLDRCAAR